MTDLIKTLIAEKTYSNPDIVAAAADTVSSGEFEQRDKVSSVAHGAHINLDPVVMSYIR